MVSNFLDPNQEAIRCSSNPGELGGRATGGRKISRKVIIGKKSIRYYKFIT